MSDLITDFCRETLKDGPWDENVERLAKAYLDLKKRLQAADRCAECLDHAFKLGHVGWASEALASWRKLRHQPSAEETATKERV